MSDLHEKSLSEVRCLLASRAVSAEETVRACLARIEATEPKVRALLHVAGESALAQAKALDEMLAKRGSRIDLVLRLKVDDEQLLNRVAGRFAESGRPDDNPESFKVRLGAYNEQTAPLLPYYQGQDKLTEVDGMGSIASVAKAIDGALA